jgi:hypothetical protein
MADSLLPGLGSGELILTSAFVAYETSFNFSQFLPSIMTIRSFVDTNEKLQAIRHGEMIAAVYSGGFAALFSYILKSPLPVMLAGIAIAATIVVYEWALRGAPIYTRAPIDGIQSMSAMPTQEESTAHDYSGQDYVL